MRIVADENVDCPIIQHLREDGHEVVAILETRPGASDQDVLDYLAGGMSEDQVLADFPAISRADIRAALAFAAARERRLASPTT